MPENYLIQVKYLQQDQIQKYLSNIISENSTPLLLLEHSTKSTRLTETKPKSIHLTSGLESIGTDNQSSWYELWYARGHWEQASQQTSLGTPISYYQNEQFLLGSISIQLSNDLSLQEISQIYYAQLIEFINSQMKSHLIRMWNYIPDINALDSLSGEQLERYQQFCVGRHIAFVDGPKYPAASAVGNLNSKMVIIFIATKQGGFFLENPDQISAYHYPQKYSPKSPSFARASVYQTHQMSQLHISGTASIVGHESMFINDITGQTKQTIKNLKTLIQYTNEQVKLNTPFTLRATENQSPAIKVYLRKPDDFEKVSRLLQQFFPDCNNICYLQADICRQELDIEIEVLCIN